MRRIAEMMRRLADRIDPAGAPRCTGLSFTFESGTGLVVHRDRTGCPLWYWGSADYDRAFSEADLVGQFDDPLLTGYDHKPGRS